MYPMQHIHVRLASHKYMSLKMKMHANSVD